MKRYQSMFMESFIQDLQKSIKSLASLLKQYGIRFTIIGGGARSQYKVYKTTEDVDIVVAKEDKDKMKNLPIGYIKELSKGRAKVFQLHNPPTKIEVIYEGEVSGDGVHGLIFEDPSKISKEIDGVPFITLSKLIEYKLSSGIYGNRYKDFDDIQQLIIKNNLKRNFADKFRTDLKQKYFELFDGIKNIKEI